MFDITDPDVPLSGTEELFCSPPQSKYREAGRRSLSQSFYSQLPETAETQFAKAVAELQSQVRYRYSVIMSFKNKVLQCETEALLAALKSRCTGVSQVCLSG